MRSLLSLVFLSLVGPAQAGAYEDCILSELKGATNSSAVAAIKRACEVKATPMRCREAALQPHVAREIADRREKHDRMLAEYENRRTNECVGAKPPIIRESCIEAMADAAWQRASVGSIETDVWKARREQCLRECESATWYTRKFGDCRTG